MRWTIAFSRLPLQPRDSLRPCTAWQHGMAATLTDQVICLQFDVFSFFPEELEAVSTNFYTDLWQAVRMHTPKTSLKAMSGDEQAVAAMQQEIEVLLNAWA